MKKREPVGRVVVPEPREANAPVVRAGGDERVAPAAVVVRVEPPRERVHRARRGVRVARRGDDETSSEALAISIFFSRRRIRRRFANPVVAVRAPARAQAHHPDDARGRRARDGAAERAHERRVGFGFRVGVVGVRRRRRRSRKAGAGGGERDAPHPRVRLHDDAPGEGPPTSAGIIGASRLLERFFFVRARERASVTVSSRVVVRSFRRLLRTSGKSRGRRRLRDARTTRRTRGGPLVLVRLGQRRAERPRSAVSRSFALALALVPGVHGLEFAPHGVERGEASPRSGPVGELGVVGDAREGDQGAERVEVARVAGFEDGAELAERRDDGVRVRGIVARGGLLGGVGGARLRAREELEETPRGGGARRRRGDPPRASPRGARRRRPRRPSRRRGRGGAGTRARGRADRPPRSAFEGERARRTRGRGAGSGDGEGGGDAAGASSARGGGGRAAGRVRARAPGLRLERPERVRQPRVLEKIKQHRHDVLAPSRRGTRGGHRPADARGGARAAAGNEWTGGR